MDIQSSSMYNLISWIIIQCIDHKSVSQASYKQHTNFWHLSLIKNVRIFHKTLMFLQASLTFPAVLERMQLQAFDLCTIVESFARHEPTLPKAMQIHLFRVEEMIMESLAWEKGSSFYPKLLEACVPGKLSQYIFLYKQPNLPYLESKTSVPLPS